jgi:predicted nucleotidyltransferase
LKEKDRTIALELKNRIAEYVQLVDFRVFGSRARGDAWEDSDMDIFVEVETLDKSLKKRTKDTAWEVGFENFLVISTLIFTRDELVNTPIRSSSIVKAITNEGLRVGLRQICGAVQAARSPQ